MPDGTEKRALPQIKGNVVPVADLLNVQQDRKQILVQPEKLFLLHVVFHSCQFPASVLLTILWLSSSEGIRGII